jgi:integrase
MQYKNVLALRVSLETGLRIDDVLKIKKSDIKGRTIRGISEKTNKPFKKVISKDLANRLTEISGKIFIFEHRLKVGEHRTRQAVWKDLKKASKVLGLKGNIAPHSARKTYAVELFKDSGLDKVQKELQHDNTSTTMIYAFADLLSNDKTNVPDFDFELFAEMVADKVSQKIKSLLQ